MSRLATLEDARETGWILLSPTLAARELRDGLIVPIPGFRDMYLLTRAGRAFVEMVRRVRA